MEDFFKKQTPSSRIKANIVAEYFPQYCKILLKRPQSEIRYLDLFSGPGLYEDDSKSTPLLIAKSCAEDPLLADKVRLMFNDNKYSSELKDNFYNHFSDTSFSYTPRFGSKTVGEDETIHDYLIRPLGKPNPYPTLLFFDPWGYKGIDTLALAKFLKNWGNEIFLFVNIKRIHAAIENQKFDELMTALFPTSIERIRKDRKYEAESVYKRLNLIMDNLASEFETAVNGKLYHTAFKFQEEDNKATSHFIIHFTKHSKGYELVKSIYNRFDNIGAALEKDGVYTFDAKKLKEKNSSIDFGDQNISALSNDIINKYRGKILSAKKLYDEHHVNTKFCYSHYTNTLRFMVERGQIEAEFVDNKKHKVPVLISEECKLKIK